jgi:hypothetical protein
VAFAELGTTPLVANDVLSVSGGDGREKTAHFFEGVLTKH